VQQADETRQTVDDLPEWAIKAVRRLTTLPDGRHVIIVTKTNNECDLTVAAGGKVERLK
jgi:hypothetical protein